MPLIEARRKVKQERLSKAKEDKDDEFVVSYMDTLLDLELPEEEASRRGNGYLVLRVSQCGHGYYFDDIAMDHGEFGEIPTYPREAFCGNQKGCWG